MSRHQSTTAVNDEKMAIDKDEWSELFGSKSDELLKFLPCQGTEEWCEVKQATPKRVSGKSDCKKQ